jgi:tRNA A-37 threonylcarbamoyl transferase component Bud32
VSGSIPRWQPGKIKASFGRSAKLYDRAAKSGEVVAVPFGRYLLLERIKRGGMAEVYRAKFVAAEGFEKIVAIKRILPHLAANDDFVSMFIDEAKIVSLLNHQNICPVIELGRCDDGLYIVMEYIWGRDLRQILNALGRAGRLMPLTVAAYLAGRIAQGLDYAHRRIGPQGQRLNIVHRDVSPQNVLVSFDGEVRIIDFGIAHANRRSTQTRVGTFKGKFAYMSPEQARGKDIDRRSDIFSVGIILHEMITGNRLFAGKTDLDTLEQVRTCEVPVPTRPFEVVPDELTSIVLKALAAEPGGRFQWAGEMQEALDRFLMRSGELATVSRLGNWMCVNFAEQAARALADQESAARARALGADELRRVEEEAAHEEKIEEYIALRENAPHPEEVQISSVELRSEAVPPPRGVLEAQAPAGGPSGAHQADQPLRRPKSGGEVVAIPPLDPPQSPAAGVKRPSSGFQIEYTPWTGQASDEAREASHGGSSSVVAGDSGILVSAGVVDESDDDFILDSGPPARRDQRVPPAEVSSRAPCIDAQVQVTPVEAAVAVVEIEVSGENGRPTDLETDMDLPTLEPIEEENDRS